MKLNMQPTHVPILSVQQSLPPSMNAVLPHSNYVTTHNYYYLRPQLNTQARLLSACVE